MAKETLNRWQKWVKEIEEDVTLLSKHREVYNNLHSIINRNTRIQRPSHFYSFIHYTYYESTIHRIRKQVKIHDDHASIAKLLDHIIQNPEPAAKHNIISSIKHKYDKVAPGLAENMIKNIHKYYPPNPQNVHDHDLLKNSAVKDIEILNDKAQLCEQFAAKWLAHYNPEQDNFSAIKTFQEIEDTVDTIKLVYKKYSMILSGSSAEFFSLDNKLGWQMIFREPWLP